MARRSTWGSKREKYPGCWELRWRVAGEPGGEYFHGTDKEADARLAVLRIKYEGLDACCDVTVGQYYDAKFVDYIRRDLAPTTVPGYMGMFEKHIRPVFGDMPIGDVRPRALQEWLLTMTRSNAKHARAVLSSLLSYAVIDELIGSNPLRNRYRIPKAPGARRVDKGVYTQAELDEIARRCRGEFWEAPFLLAAFGGASRHEAVGVQPGDVDDVGGYAVIRLSRGAHRVEGRVIVREELKNEFRPRDLVIEPPHAQRILELADRAHSEGWAWLCDDGFGSPIDPGTVSKAFSRWFKTQDIVYHPFANLRNSRSTILLSRGLDGSMVAKMIGNEQRGTTEIHYERPSAADFIAALAAAPCGQTVGTPAHNETERSGASSA